MLKTSGSIESKIRPGEGGVWVNGSKAGRDGSKLDGSEFNGGEVDGGEVDGSEVEGNKLEMKVQNLSQSKNLSKSKKMVGLDFFTLGAKLAFTKLREVLLKSPILPHFDPERHIRIETNALGYAIGGFLSQLTSDNLGR